MDTRQVIDESVGPYSLSATFNKDNSCFSVGLETGFCIFNSNPCELKVSRDFNAGIGAVEMLGQTNYLALVGGGRKPKLPQNKLIIWDDAKQKVAITLEFKTSVLGVSLSRSRIVVALLNSVHVYAFSTRPEKLSNHDTIDNPLGLICLGEKLLAFPGRSKGQVHVLELKTGNISIIPAHESPLRAMALSHDGEMLATASEAGTLIRIFSTKNCTRLTEVRRGLDHAVIFSISFCPSNNYLAVTSDKGTLHVFSVGEAPTQKWGILGKIPMLPRVFSDKYSSASADFAMGDEAFQGQSSVQSSHGRPRRGVIGWLDDNTILVIGSGREGRWEKFQLGAGDDGKLECRREGWKRYLGA